MQRFQYTRFIDRSYNKRPKRSHNSQCNKETLSLIKPASKLGEKPVIENFSALDITNQLSLGGTKWQELCKQQSIKKMGGLKKRTMVSFSHSNFSHFLLNY